jgi:hypothetical protein
MSLHEYPITLQLPQGTLEGIPAEWHDAEDGGPITLIRAWLRHLPVSREDVGWIVGLDELRRQERMANERHAETEHERQRQARQAQLDFQEAAE